MTAAVLVVDSGLGNGRSVVNMARRGEFDAAITNEPAELAGANVVILPGVGAFDAGMRRLRETGFEEALRQHHVRGGVILGICLGMQLLSRGSEEGTEDGLGLVDAHFRSLTGAAPKVPHVGWNRAIPQGESALFGEEQGEQRFYFVHSFAAEVGPSARSLATVRYGIEFPCAYQQGAIYGVQFHPEKSHRYGLSLLRRFLSAHA